MKKAVVLILAALLCVSLISCSKTPGKNGQDSSTTAPSELTPEQENAVPDPSPEGRASEQEIKLTVCSCEANTPLIKMEDGSNSRLLKEKQIENADQYDFYTIAVTAVIHEDKTLEDFSDVFSAGAERLDGVGEDLFRIDKHVSAVESEQISAWQDVGGFSADFKKVFYLIEYAVEKGTDPDVRLLEYGGQEIAQLSGISYNGKAVESGEAHLWDTIKVTDEYGADHYLIPMPPVYRCDTACGQKVATPDTEGYSGGYLEFDLAQVGDGKEAGQQFWNMESAAKLDISFARYRYNQYKSPKFDKSIQFNDSGAFADITHLERNNRIFECRINMFSSAPDESSFSPDDPLILKLNDVQLIFDNMQW